MITSHIFLVNLVVKLLIIYIFLIASFMYSQFLMILISIISTGAEENLLCLPSDRYHAEDIFLHEFSHGIHEIAVRGGVSRLKILSTNFRGHCFRFRARGKSGVNHNHTLIPYISILSYLNHPGRYA